VRFLLEQSSNKFDYQEINLTAKEQQSEWYKSINPSGKVPALVVNGKDVITIIFQ